MDLTHVSTLSVPQQLPFARKALYAVAGLALVVLLTKLVLTIGRAAGEGVVGLSDPMQATVREAMRAPSIAGTPPAVLPVADTLLGRSKALRFVALSRSEAADLKGFIETYGEMAIRSPGVWVTPLADGSSFAYVIIRPFGEKRGEYLNGYRLGRWPAERWMMARNYFNPDGFVEVTERNAALPLSLHFTLGDFVTHDQNRVWPKYVVLEEKLVDKLELVMQDLQQRGFRADHAVVLSGFRAPYYNARGVGEGMARSSRHQYGDAADVLIDSDRDGRMDDLNRDGRVTMNDIAPVAAAVARVERAHPELVGGLGTYTAMGPSGPFLHVDVRGTSARWESGWFRRKAGGP